MPVGGYYELYYFFPLTQVETSLAQIQRTLVLAGLVLVLLLRPSPRWSPGGW